MRKITLAVVVVLGLFGAFDATQAAAITYTGADGGNWNDDGNWSGGAAPAANDTVQINSGDTVNLDVEWPANPLEINLDGTMTQSGAMRLWNIRLNASATATNDLTGSKWLVLWGGGTEVSFDSGATFIQDTGRIQFANNADQTLGFNLAAGGFDTISANLLHFDGYAGQTIEADMADYAGGAGTIVLMDLTGNNGMTASIFTNDLNPQVVNAGAYAGSYLQWNETTSAIELVIPPYQWDGGGADNNWTTAENWSTDVAPASGDTVQINSGDIVNLDVEWPANPLEINLDGTMTQSGAMRLWNIRLNASATATNDLTGSKWLVLWGGGTEVSFDSGATFIQDTGRIQFANNADQTLGFNLAAGGFDTISANLLHFDGYAGQTIEADMADYAGGAGTIVLMDLTGNNGMTASIFTNDLNPQVVNADAYAGSYLQWNETTSAIELVIPPYEWDGGGSDDNWNTAANWNYDEVPGASDEVVIGSSYTVTNAQSEFAKLSIGAGSTVTFGEELSGGVVTNAGTMDYAGVFRLNGAAVHLTGAGSLGSNITFLDLSGGDISFEDGASFGNTGMSFEHKGSNRFDFELSASGFTTLTAGTLHVSSDIANATYVVDMANYTGPVATIDLMDFSSGGTLTDAQFQTATLTVSNGGSYLGSYLQWDDPGDKVQLVIVIAPYEWDAGGGDDNWNTAANWNYDQVPGAANEVIIDSSYTVTNAQSEFATLSIGSGSTVTFGEELSGGVVTNAGTMDYAGVFRLNGARVHLTGTGSLGPNITFLDLTGGDLSFEDGASFGNSGMSFEHKGANRFDFELSASGFTALTSGTLHLSSDIVNATYVVDMANYTGPVTSIDLMDFSSGGTLTDAQFQTATLTVSNAGAYEASLVWDDANDKVQLAIRAAGTVFKFR